MKVGNALLNFCLGQVVRRERTARLKDLFKSGAPPTVLLPIFFFCFFSFFLDKPKSKSRGQAFLFPVNSKVQNLEVVQIPQEREEERCPVLYLA